MKILWDNVGTFSQLEAQKATENKQTTPTTTGAPSDIYPTTALRCMYKSVVIDFLKETNVDLHRNGQREGERGIRWSRCRGRSAVAVQVGIRNRGSASGETGI